MAIQNNLLKFSLFFSDSNHPPIIVNIVKLPKKNKLLGSAMVIANPEPIKTPPQTQRELFKS